jgi:hypothetical protein
MADDGPKCCCDLKPHPDHLVTETLLLQGGKRWQVLPYYTHILYAEAIVHAGAETDEPYVKLFTSDDPDDETIDEAVWTLAPKATLGSSAYTPEDVRGLAFPKGVFAHIQTADTTTYVVLNVIGVRREHYTPAFPDTTQWLLNAWKCWREGELYSNFDEGENNGWDNNGDTGTASGELDGNLKDS